MNFHVLRMTISPMLTWVTPNTLPNCVCVTPPNAYLARISNTCDSFNFAWWLRLPSGLMCRFLSHISCILTDGLPTKRWRGRQQARLSHLCKICLPLMEPQHILNTNLWHVVRLKWNWNSPYPSLFLERVQFQHLPRCGACAGMPPFLSTIFQNLSIVFRGRPINQNIVNTIQDVNHEPSQPALTRDL